MIIAIDGPSGSGKSTVARSIARRLGITYIDTGAMYRCVTMWCLEHNISATDEDATARAAAALDIDLTYHDGAQQVLVNGTNCTGAIRSAEVDANVSSYAALPKVRALLVEKQRRLAQAKHVVAEGRDIGTAVFPSAEVKIFLTANAQARAHRRAVQRAGGDVASGSIVSTTKADEAAILANLLHRDDVDSHRKTAPLKAAPDAFHIDSSDKTVDEIVSIICARAQPYFDSTAAATSASTQSASARDAAAGATAAPASAAASAASAAHTERYSWFYAHAMSEFPRASRVFLAILCAILFPITKLLWRWRCFDEIDVRTLAGKPYIVVMNHVSAIEPLITMLYLHHKKIPLRTMYKSEFNRHRFVAYLFAIAGGIPVVRASADMTCMHWCTQALSRGEWLLVYPEGTRVRNFDVKPPIRAGFAFLALRTHADIIPAAVSGAFSIAQARSFVHKFSRVCIGFAAPLSHRPPASPNTEGSARMSKKKMLELLERESMNRVYTLRDELKARFHTRA